MATKRKKSFRKNPVTPPVSGQKNGASEETRTLDIHLGKVTLYQLSYTRAQTQSRNLPQKHPIGKRQFRYKYLGASKQNTWQRNRLC